MKIFRLIENLERKALQNGNSTFYKHETCHREDWILNPHPEDYNSGKFFFFTMEDTLMYASQVYSHLSFENLITIMKLDIDESVILPYLAYGIYYYKDFNSKGELSSRCEHIIPELLLPYSIVDEKLKARDFEIIEFDREIFFNKSTNDKYKFNMPYKTDRPKAFVDFSEVLYEKILTKRIVDLNKKQLEAQKSLGYRIRLQDAQKKFDKVNALFPKAYEDFMECMKEYEWGDFCIDKSEDFITSPNITPEPQTERER